jgi:GDPmannose 4,6-dehydratase
MKKAIITGITGQDGAYLAEFLLNKGYEVHGLIRRASTHGTLERIEHIKDQIIFHTGDLTDANVVSNLIQEIQPDEVYNLAAQSHVKVSFSMPHYTANVDGIGAVTILEAIRSAGLNTRYYQASTSELYGSTPPPQSETTKFHPRSPYAAAKLYAYWVTINYREAYGIHATNGILFNHESPRRGETFVTRKITRAVAAIANKKQEKLYLGNMDAIRDWGYAKEYVEGMWMMLQQDSPDDYVAATGVGATIKDFCEAAFSRANLNWEDYVAFDPQYLRPTEVDALIGDPSKTKKVLGWEAKTHWKELAELMVEADLRLQE